MPTATVSVAAWRSGNGVRRVNEVTLGPVSTGMDDRGKPPRYVITLQGQLSLLPSAER